MGSGASKKPAPEVPVAQANDLNAKLLDGDQKPTVGDATEKPPPYNPNAAPACFPEGPSASAPTLLPEHAATPPARPLPQAPASRGSADEDIDAAKAAAQQAFNPYSAPPLPSVPGPPPDAPTMPQDAKRIFCANCGTELMGTDSFCFNCGHPTNVLTPQTSYGVPPPPPLPPQYEPAGAPMPPEQVPLAPISNSSGAQAPMQQPGTFVVSLPAEVLPGVVMKVPVPPPFPQQGQMAKFRVPDAIPHNRLVYVPLPPLCPPSPAAAGGDVSRGVLLH